MGLKRLFSVSVVSSLLVCGAGVSATASSVSAAGGAPGLQAAGPNLFAIDAFNEAVPYRVYNMGFGDDGDECRVELRNAQNNALVAADEFTVAPATAVNRHLDITAAGVENAGRGDYRLRLSCETSHLHQGPGGSEAWPTRLLSATRTTVVRAPNRPGKIVTTSTRFSPSGWRRASRAWVSIQRRTSDGTFQTTVTKKATGQGTAAFTKPTGGWRARTMQLDGLAASTATLHR